MRTPIRSGGLLVGLCLWATSASAQGEVWVCEDPVTGGKTYHNIQANSKGCKKLEGGNVTTVPAAKAGPRAAAAPSGASKGDGDKQRARDTDRKQIFQDELAAEQKKLDQLKKEYNGGEPERQGDERNFQKYQERVQRMKEDIERTESNIKNLQRELQRLG